MVGMEDLLSWDDSYAIALALKARHPGVALEDISLGTIYRWTLELPEFQDDHELANDSVLAAIYREWFEEVNSI
jgi:FeS assembly protein IscX